MRITRRDFMKYCATAAGALGLTTTDLGKLEKALATSVADGGTQVIWLNGAACTGCTVTLANTSYYSSIQDLLVPWAKAAGAVVAASVTTGVSAGSLIALNLTDTAANGPLDLVFMETLSSAVGHRAIEGAKAARNSGAFVLCIEGAIQTANMGAYCKIGDGTSASDTDTIAFMDEVREFALSTNCVAILAVGTCASFGGIPAAKGSNTGARGLISTGRISGGYKTTNTQGLWDYFKETDSTTDHVSSITVSAVGSGYTANPTVTIAAPTGVNGVQAVANAFVAAGTVAQIVVTNQGYGYTGIPTVTLSAPGGTGTTATAGAVMANANYLTNDEWTSLMSKTICVSGCPPHPDWIVGTIVYLLSSAPTFEPPLMDKYHRPMDFYGEYQCTNCLWQANKVGQTNTGAIMYDIDNKAQSLTAKSGPTEGNSPRLYKWKYNSAFEGCIGILGCKGRKTKADCSFRRWNSNDLLKPGTGWCVQTRAGCHGCTEPRYPDGWGKFFSYK